MPKDTQLFEGDMSDDDNRRLIDMRGGCRCHLCPPCGACSNPVTLAEAEDLGLIEAIVPTLPLNLTKEDIHDAREMFDDEVLAQESDQPKEPA